MKYLLLPALALLSGVYLLYAFNIGGLQTSPAFVSLWAVASLLAIRASAAYIQHKRPGVARPPYQQKAILSAIFTFALGNAALLLWLCLPPHYRAIPTALATLAFLGLCLTSYAATRHYQWLTNLLTVLT